MKLILTIVLALAVISCTPGLQRKFDKSSQETDLIAVSEQISVPEFELLKKYILELESNKQSFDNKTYIELLVDAETKENLKQQRIQEEIQKEKKKIETEKIEKVILFYTKLLCENKWKIKEYAFQLELPDDSEQTILMAKDLLNKAMYVKNSDLIFSVIKDFQRTIVKGAFDARMLKLFTNNDKRFKTYFSDGTYKDIFGNEVTHGTWKFIGANKIQENRPSDGILSRNKQDVYILDISILDENSFHFCEKKYDPIDENSPVSASIMMKH